MTVKEMIERLGQMPPGATVLILGKKCDENCIAPSGDGKIVFIENGSVGMNLSR